MDVRAAAWERLDCRRARRRRWRAVLRARAEAEEADAADLRAFLAAARRRLHADACSSSGDPSPRSPQQQRRRQRHVAPTFRPRRLVHLRAGGSSSSPPDPPPPPPGAPSQGEGSARQTPASSRRSRSGAVGQEAALPGQGLVTQRARRREGHRHQGNVGRGEAQRDARLSWVPPSQPPPPPSPLRAGVCPLQAGWRQTDGQASAWPPCWRGG